MKAVPKVNTNGLYLEDTLVDDAFSGVVPFYSHIGQGEPNVSTTVDATEPDDEPSNDSDSNISGYIVGIPTTSACTARVLISQPGVHTSLP
ncbi:hypothetical protein C169_13849 [Paenibacillus sp. FSL R5-808]|nr:hypothetical protein [Paenibacillus sp. FSL R5-808]ETT37950.1 hypothetical protein C169_13849 [Paenibacillus sp. FSL R5-808]